VPATSFIITKQASGKIDPLMAAFNAIALMPTNPLVDAAEHICDLIVRLWRSTG